MLDPGGWTHRRRSTWAAAALATLALGVAIVCVLMVVSSGRPEESDTELLLKVHLAAHEPYSPPSNMYLWWGPSTNHRFVGSGEHIRHLLAMGNIEGGEWRDPMFLGNNGVQTFRSQRFRRISEACCSTIVMPPFEWDFPVYNTHMIIGQRIRNFVANGNMLVLTGGIMALEFINSYFFYNIELVDGNYSPGPFRMLPGVPDAMKNCPKVLPQKGIAVTAVKKESLPSGTQVLWGTPRSSAVFMIKFCEAQNPMEGMPPTKVLPRDCPAAEADGRPCSCGNLMYIGYDFKEQYPTRYDHVLRGAVEILNPAPEPVGDKKKSPVQSLHAVDHDSQEDTQLAESQDDSTQKQNTVVKTASRNQNSVDVQQKVAMQKLEIRHLQHKLNRLQTEKKAVHKYTGQEKARTVQLSELKDEAAKLIGEIKSAAGGQDEANRRNAEDGADKLLLKSVTSLAKDVRKLNSKVDTLAHKEQREEQDKREEQHEERREREDERKEKKREIDSEAKDEARAYKDKAEAYKKELAYEQAVPEPEYTYSESGHTQPYFTDDGKALHKRGREGGSTLNKLKNLVESTRQSIEKELESAMDQ